ncbi:hypothetical protein ACIRVF_42655 [Kitasatospora sp. NPDC101157]|uniref:hypothetical protein n=1 Tax=Kitasatospora sp. NPDC101157 TaxID=3364098 RepID=UPI003810B165
MAASRRAWTAPAASRVAGGRLIGWTEVYDDNTSWIALINGHPVADAADNLPLLSANPTDALTLLRLAIARDLGSLAPGWVLPRTSG